MDNNLFNQISIEAEIIYTVFRNADNMYSIIKVYSDEPNEYFESSEITVTGYLPEFESDSRYIFRGMIKNHPKYGVQLAVESFEKVLPKTEDGIVQYLSSHLFKGIGKKIAQSIVDTLGVNALKLIASDRSALDKVPKLSTKKKDDIYHLILQNQALEQVMVKLSEWELGPKVAMRVYQLYKEQTIEKIEENPYRLIEDVEGIGFQRADQLALQLGISQDSPYRVQAAILYILNMYCNSEGHTYMTQSNLQHFVMQLVNKNLEQALEASFIEEQLDYLVLQDKLVCVENNYFIPSLYYAELNVAENIIERLQQNDLPVIEQSDFLLNLGEIEERLSVNYATKQQEAIKMAMEQPIMILTGGPGTGKTTVVKGILEMYAKVHDVSLKYQDYHKNDTFPILLAAPTGRAAKRLSETTGMQATTIHRMIGLGLGLEEVNNDIDIEADLIIIDETSMVDCWLMNHLLKIVPITTQILFVGDKDQLPSVGPGQILKDMIMSNRLPTIELDTVFRQEEGSSIVQLANQIKHNQKIDILAKQSDRVFIPCDNQQIPQVISQVVKSAINKGYDKQDIQVLAPMYKGPAGIDFLNQELQKILNPDAKKSIDIMDKKYFIGDKVLQLVNRPEDNVFNGDIGEVIAISYAKENKDNKDLLYVDYDGNEVVYSKQDLIEINHAYCCSIHKSQGSEFPIVILPISKSHYRMLRKNILYTAITRAKQSLVLCGDVYAFERGIINIDNIDRHTQLIHYLVSGNKKNEKNYQRPERLTADNFYLIDPMINMKDVTPFDFLEELVQ